MESIDDGRSDTHDFPIPASKRPKLSGIDFYKYTLGAPKYVVCKYTLIHCLFTYFTIYLMCPEVLSTRTSSSFYHSINSSLLMNVLKMKH